MKKTVVIGVMGLLAAACGDGHRAGSRSTVTAFEPDGVTVIKVESCPRFGRSYDYIACGNKLRSEVSSMLCSRGGAAHAWLYQIGGTNPIPETARCR